MKICPECARSYSDEAVVCAFDGTPLSTGTTAAWDQDQAAEPQVGDVLGSYKIVSRIGHGGMGVIYEAEHVRIGRKVALKVLRSKLVPRTDLVRRFFEEARAVNEIGHPNIVDIIDFVEVVDEDPPLVYMVMELLSGEDLRKRLDRTGPLDAVEAAAVTTQVADALSAVHRVNILHRDLKPENIYLTDPDTGEQPRVKLLDFGVAKAFGQRPSDHVTNPGTAVGTPEYMAPEQVLERELDERSDIYALGIVLYEMLCGSVPFTSASYHDLLIMQVERLPEPLSKRRPSLPLALQDVVMRCLKKKPAERYQTAGDFKGALQAAVGYHALPEEPRRPPVNRWRLPLIIAVAALLVWGAVAFFVSKRTGRKSRTAAPSQTQARPTPPSSPDSSLIIAIKPDASPATKQPEAKEPKLALKKKKKKKRKSRRHRARSSRRRRRAFRARAKPRGRAKVTKTKTKTKTKPRGSKSIKKQMESTVDPFKL